MRKKLGIVHLNPGWWDGPREPVPVVRAACVWSSVGPTNINGRVTDIAIDPNDNQKIFVTSVGGIWRSLDGGRRWQRVSDEFIATVFASVAVNPSDSNVVYAGAGDPNYAYALGLSGIGIWRSTSAGAPASWNKVSPPELDGQVIFRLRIDPAPPNDVYAATSAGVFVGTASGATWSRLAGFDAGTTDLAIDFSSSPRKVYAGASESSSSFSHGIWKYDGFSWQKRNSGIQVSQAKTIALALAPSNPSIIYAKVQKGSDDTLLGVFKTTTAGEQPPTGGNAWTKLRTASELATRLDDANAAGYNSILAVDPTDPATVYGGGACAWRTTDGGAQWENVFSGSQSGNSCDSGSPFALHFDQHAIAFDPSNSKIVYAGNDGGIYRTTDTSSATWHWNHISHGMLTTEFYRITSAQSSTTLVAGGTQDNGTEISFGNRTWYNPGCCDGFDAAVDNEYSTFYVDRNRGVVGFSNPVPGTPGGGTELALSSLETPIPPFVVDPSKASAALSAGDAGQNRQVILKTTNTVNWSRAKPQELPVGREIAALAVAPSSNFQTYYVAVAADKKPVIFPTTHCDSPAVAPTIWRTANGGTTWDTTANGLPGDLWPNRLAIDYSHDDRAFVAFGGCSGGSVLMTMNRGANWTALPGSGANAIPNAAVTSVAIDPNDPSVIYAATTIGVFRGQVSDGPPPTASWAPFDDGLPDGTDTNDLWVDRDAALLTVGTVGHGAYQRDIRPGTQCQDTMLLVRDNVFDRGLNPSTPPSGLPDSEHPIQDPVRPELFRPDNTTAGRVYWWNSTDIRIDVPSNDLPANKIGSADHVEMETCPIEVTACPDGTMMDSNPAPGQSANVYVQVMNKGIRPASNVRVTALWTDGTTALPVLPLDFWSTTFPAGSTNCGTLNTGTGWNAVDPSHPCRVIPVINPELPEVVQFGWTVPATAPQQRAMLAIVESADDPISATVRSTNEVRPEVLVPENRQIGLRNVQVIDEPPDESRRLGLATINLPSSGPREGPMDLLISRAGMGSNAQIAVLLPPTPDVKLSGVKRAPATLDQAQRERLAGYGIDTSVAYFVTGSEGSVGNLPIPFGKSWKIAVQYYLSGGEPNVAYRFALVAREGKSILGGSSYLIRIRKAGK